MICREFKDVTPNLIGSYVKATSNTNVSIKKITDVYTPENDQDFAITFHEGIYTFGY